MQVKDIMNDNVTWVKPDDTADAVAQKMRENDSGAILVGDQDKMVGMITDRDLAVKIIANDKEPHEVKADEVMSQPVLYCYEDQDAEAVADNMLENKALRLFVVDRNKRARGVVAHSDLADAVIKNQMFDQPLAEKVIKLASKIAA